MLRACSKPGATAVTTWFSTDRARNHRGAPARVTLTPETRDSIAADARDVSLFTVAVVDAQGRVVPNSNNTEISL